MCRDFRQGGDLGHDLVALVDDLVDVREQQQVGQFSLELADLRGVAPEVDDPDGPLQLLNDLGHQLLATVGACSAGTPALPKAICPIRS